MKVDVKWTTNICYERQIELDEDQVAELKADYGGDLESYFSENVDELMADYEEDYEDGGLSSQIEERGIVQAEATDAEDDDEDEGD
jgi:hypothetical protein